MRKFILITAVFTGLILLFLFIFGHAILNAGVIINGRIAEPVAGSGTKP